MKRIFDIRLYRERFLIAITLCAMLIAHNSCRKYLEKKPVQNFAVPSSLDDLQALLDNEIVNVSSPGYLEYVADNFYNSSEAIASATDNDRLHYVWDRNATTSNEIWTEPYKVIYHANFVLSQLPRIVFKESEQARYNSIKGQALFLRAFMFHQLAQLFCKPYSTTTAGDLGIVVRTTADVEVKPVRGTVQDTYDQILEDLKEATELLPIGNVYSTRASRPAAYALLARVCLSMRDYTNGEKYASECLAINSDLLDFNTLTPSGDPMLPSFLANPEVLFLSYEAYMPISQLEPSSCRIDTFLFDSYADDDIRKAAFFGSFIPDVHYWEGSYFPDIVSFLVFDGLATDEVYLIRAECRARRGDAANAMDDLNRLLRHRWKTGTFTDLTASDANDALSKVLIERRKELLFRGLRWSDLRRFNLDGMDITLRRFYKTEHTLPPNDLRWVLLIPNEEIIRSGIQQNPR